MLLRVVERVVEARRVSEAALGAFALVHGLWLMLPADTFGTAAGYAAMARVGPEWVWGAVLAALGMVQMIARGRWRAGARMWPALLAAVLWGTITLEVARGNPASMGIPTYAMATAGALWLALRLGAREDG